MIFGNISNVNETDFNESIKFCFDIFQNNQLEKYTKGQYKTSRADISFRIDEYETQIAQERYWQAHKEHLDLYILLKGQERIDVNVYGGKVYHHDRLDDILMLEDMNGTNINLLTKYGDFLICNPGEAHKTGIHVELKNKFKIVLFKIAI